MSSLNNISTFYSFQISNIKSNINCYSNPEIFEQDNNDHNSENNEICSNINENFNNYKQNLIFLEKTDSFHFLEHYSEEEITKGMKRAFSANNIYGDEEENFEKKEDKNTEVKQKDYEQDIGNNNIKKIMSFEQKNNKNNKRPKKKISTKNLNIKRKKPIFKTTNSSYQFGNNLSNKSFRVSNLKSKTLRNFIQEIIPFWITGKIPKKCEKLNVDKIINDYKNPDYKSMKISEFLNKYIKVPNPFVDEIIKIKLEFTLREAFLCFAKETLNKKILLNVLDRLKLKGKEIDGKLFFQGLDKKAMYINSLIEKEKDYINMQKALSQLIKEFEISENCCKLDLKDIK